ncbi:hypothetical protein SDJN02_13173, partial [Cucurbita argyrosperma subsp. argyrosperma]
MVFQTNASRPALGLGIPIKAVPTKALTVMETPKNGAGAAKEKKSLQVHGAADYEQWHLWLSWRTLTSKQLQEPFHHLEALLRVLYPFPHSPIHKYCGEHSKLRAPPASPEASPPSASAGSATVPSAEQRHL